MKRSIKLSSRDLYNLCVENHWCTRMTCEEYDRMLHICDDEFILISSLFHAIERITQQIISKSDVDFDDKEGIMNLILHKCSYMGLEEE